MDGELKNAFSKAAMDKQAGFSREQVLLYIGSLLSSNKIHCTLKSFNVQ